MIFEIFEDSYTRTHISLCSQCIPMSCMVPLELAQIEIRLLKHTKSSAGGKASYHFFFPWNATQHYVDCFHKFRFKQKHIHTKTEMTWQKKMFSFQFDAPLIENPLKTCTMLSSALLCSAALRSTMYCV